MLSQCEHGCTLATPTRQHINQHYFICIFLYRCQSNSFLNVTLFHNVLSIFPHKNFKK